MVNQQLVGYLKQYLSQGYTFEQLQSHLISQGFSVSDISEAYRYLYPSQPKIVQPDSTKEASHHSVNAVAIVLIILAIAGLGFGAFWYLSLPVCGNDKLEDGETSTTCCQDAGCLGDQSCVQDVCIEPSCATCQYISDHRCTDYECCDDAGCDDSSISTLDACLDNSCTHLSIFECTDGDGYCPPFCIQSTDSDCTDDRFIFRKQGYRFSYPSQWVKTEDILSGMVILTIDETTSINIVKESQDPDTSLEKYSQFTVGQLSQQMPGFVLESAEPGTLSGEPTYKMTYSVDDGQTEAYISQVLAYHDGSTYALTYGSTPERFDSDEFNSFLDGFRFIQRNITSMVRPLLWRIEGDVPSYLYGTIHITDPSVTDFRKSVLDAIESSDIIYTEILLDDTTNLKVQEMSVLQNTTIDQVLPEDIYLRTDSYLQRKGLDMSMFSNLKVWTLATTLSTIEETLQNPFGMTVDQKIYSLGLEQGSETRGLETVDEQLSIFDDLAKEEQIGLLVQTLEYLEKMDSIGMLPGDNLKEAYLEGDEIALGELLKASYEDDDPLTEKIVPLLFDKRNAIMSDRISQSIKDSPDKTQFFAIGAGHIPGKGGVVELLQERGYSVIRIEE